MSDIVEKLHMSPDKDEIITALNEVIREQQDKIEHLTAENKKLQVTLKSIAANTYGYEPDVMNDEEAKNYFAGLFFDAQNKARTALSGDKQ
jgi:hypothetical protein